ncbi:MAG: DUF480 domain-containing protein [Pirellulales bacterium]
MEEQTATTPAQTTPAETTPAETAEPKWEPLGYIERRVVGVLVEKAKTTPEQYPMTLNALRNGCNQKSNRFPQMQLDDDRVEEALERLRERGAVTEIQGDARVPKYRHQMYNWMGIEKVELAVVAELLLRGPQTVGELRGRASRMEPVPDLATLWPILASLRSRRLVVYLTPEGRGCIVTHGLYPPEELEKLRSQQGHGVAEPESGEPVASPPRASVAYATGASSSGAPAAGPSNTQGRHIGDAELREDVARLREEVAQLRHLVDQQADGLRSDVDEIRRQLGI